MLSASNSSKETSDAIKKVWEEGFNEGRLVGYEKAMQEVASLMQILRKLSARMLSETEKMSHKLKEDLVELAVLTCEKFLYRKLDDAEELTLLISAALQHHRVTYAYTPSKVYLHPEDYQKLNYWISTHDFPVIKNIEFIADTSCPKSGYKLETPSGSVRQDVREELDHLLSVLNA